MRPSLLRCFRSLAILMTFTLAAGVDSPVMAAPTSLKVALYPYVPRYQQFKDVLVQEWAKVQPGVTLDIVDAETWDGGYSSDPDPSYDVFVFDAMFMGDFISRSIVTALAAEEIQNRADFVDYAITGMQQAGSYYGIPLLGCGDLLFYKSSDTQMDQAKTLTAVERTLQQCQYTSEIPPDRRGLMIDLSGGTTNAATYLIINHSLDGVYPLVLPPTPQSLNQKAITNQKSLMRISSFYNATSEKIDYIRAQWFNMGYGRAFVGFTESMTKLSAANLQTIRFRPMPYSDTQNRPLFYVDAIGISPNTIQRGTRTLAVQLANVMTATDTMVASTISTKPGEPPQYLLPVRMSVFAAMEQQYPVYTAMRAMLTAYNPLMLNLGAGARNWLDAMKSPIKTAVQANYSCGCDFTSSTPIYSNSLARSVCEPLCRDHGGWNEQWTNMPPAPGSVCGCNACPIN